MTRLSINVHEAKTHLSRYLQKVEEGHSITLCRNDDPIAVLIPYPKKSKKREIWGAAKDAIDIPKTFFDELMDEEFPGIGL